MDFNRLAWTPLFSALILCLPAILVGCGDPYELVPVRGRVVSCEGKPPVGGRLTFQPMDEPKKTGRPPGYPGPISYGIVQEDGTFTLETATGLPRIGAVTGPHLVIFEKPLSETPEPDFAEQQIETEEDYRNYLDYLKSLPLFPPVPCSIEIQPGKIEVLRDGPILEFTLPPPTDPPASDAPAP
ncbi:hypothetical protein [Planctomicrobium sp. SH664]|uniref:hypothetical protein n=1 Tax=Planctomicrobium sp. SH664 TaxID=3448125 RepID=UPI003F5B237D